MTKTPRAAPGYAFSKELQDRLDRDGVTARDLEGKVRSVTWSAIRS